LIGQAHSGLFDAPFNGSDVAIVVLLPNLAITHLVSTRNDNAERFFRPVGRVVRCPNRPIFIRYLEI
jgi:hypothetical protein